MPSLNSKKNEASQKRAHWHSATMCKCGKKEGKRKGRPKFAVCNLL